MDLLLRNFEIFPVSDKFWAIEDAIHLVNYTLIKYKTVYVSGLLISKYSVTLFITFSQIFCWLI